MSRSRTTMSNLMVVLVVAMFTSVPVHIDAFSGPTTVTRTTGRTSSSESSRGRVRSDSDTSGIFPSLSSAPFPLHLQAWHTSTRSMTRNSNQRNSKLIQLSMTTSSSFKDNHNRNRNRNNNGKGNGFRSGTDL